MAGGEVHFEVFLKRTRKDAWTLLEALPTREEALARAAAVHAAHPAGSVRVSKETFDADERVFRSVTIHEAGGERFTEDVRADKIGELPCRGPADLVSPHARQTIGRALKAWLSRHKVTALELLHRVDLVERLEATGTEMQHAVQKVAIAQAAEAEASVQHFVKQINALIQQAVESLYSEVRRAPYPAIARGELAAVCVRIAGDPERQRRLRGAVAATLRPAKDWKAKLESLLAIADEAQGCFEQMPWALDTIGDFIAEIVEAAEARAALIGPVADLGGELDALTELFRGASVADGRLTATGARLAWFFREDRFGEARAVVARLILSELKSTKRLRASDFDAEVALNRSLADRLIVAGGTLIGIEEIAEAFVIRSGRLLEPDVVAAYLANAEHPGLEIAKLVALADHIVGDHNKRKLASYVRARLGAHATDGRFVSGPSPILQRLKELAVLARAVSEASFAASDKTEILARIDQLALAAEAKDQLFAKIAARSMPAVDKAATYLRLAARGALPPGRLCEDAKKRAMRLLSSAEARSALAADPGARATMAEIAQLVAALGEGAAAA